jgi:CheY-like chemotaxis protein
LAWPLFEKPPNGLAAPLESNPMANMGARFGSSSQRHQRHRRQTMRNQFGSILLVEDDEGDLFLMQRALKKAKMDGPLHIVTDGKMAIDFLSGVGSFSDRSRFPIPVLVFLDLKLPFLDGFEVLRWIRSTPALDEVAVVVLSSSDQPRDRQLADQLGARAYLVKPPNVESLHELLRSFKT